MDNLRNPGTSWDIDDYERFVAAVREDSPNFADVFGQLELMCNGIWPIRATERHWGNFTSHTSFPLLVLGNELDPVSPRQYGEEMASRFPGALFVKREGYGHCTNSQPSRCIDEVVRAYFVDGKLPPEK